MAIRKSTAPMDTPTNPHAHTHTTYLDATQKWPPHSSCPSEHPLLTTLQECMTQALRNGNSHFPPLAPCPPTQVPSGFLGLRGPNLPSLYWPRDGSHSPAMPRTWGSAGTAKEMQVHAQLLPADSQVG